MMGEMGDDTTTKLLIKAGGNKPDADGKTELTRAGNLRLWHCFYLFPHSFFLSSSDTAFSLVCKGQLYVVKQLLRNGCDMSLPAECSALHWTIITTVEKELSRGEYDVFGAMLEHFPDDPGKRRELWTSTPLEKRCPRWKRIVMKWLHHLVSHAFPFDVLQLIVW